MKQILQHPARLITLALVAATIWGLLFLMHAHGSDGSTCASETADISVIKLI